MPDSSAYAELTIDRLRAARDVVAEAWMTLDAQRRIYPGHTALITDLPERLAVLEGLLEYTGDRVTSVMSPEEYEAWRVRRDAAG